MPKLNPILLAVIVLLLVSLACTTPNVTVVVPPTADQNVWNTAIAQTVSVALTQTQQIILPVTGLSSPTATFTAGPPTSSPTVTLTSTPVFTSTPLIPQISVSIATNCRLGPGKIYDRVGALLVGEVAEVMGRDFTGNYWYIRNPDANSGFCWLWGEYATLSGNAAALPMFTPPPTPTPVPDFEASYSGLDTCAGWWVDIRLENTGGINFKSLSMTVRDTVTDVVQSLYTDGFTNKSGCLDTVTKDNLPPGEKRTVSSTAFAYDLTGHKMRATISLCSNTGQRGTCVTQVITFTP